MSSEGRRDGSHHQHRGRIVQEGRHGHGGHHDQCERPIGWQGASQQREPSGHEIGAAGRADRLANRDQSPQHHQDRPVDRFVSLAERERSEQDHQDGGGEEGGGDGQHSDSGEPHGTPQDRHRNEPLPHVAQTDLALSQRQTAEFLQLVRKSREVALQHENVAGLQGDVAQTLSEPLAAATDREEIDVETLVQRHALGGLTDQHRGRSYDGLDSPDLLIGILAFRGAVVSFEFQVSAGDRPLKRFRIALQEHDIAFAEDGIRQRHRMLSLIPNDARHENFVVTELGQIADRVPDNRRGRGHPRLRRIIGEIDGFVHSRGGFAPAGQKPVAKGQEGHASRREAEADRGEVEHAEGLPGQFLAHTGDDDVGRGADERDQASEQ